jgi:hypothetical protein
VEVKRTISGNNPMPYVVCVCKDDTLCLSDLTQTHSCVLTPHRRHLGISAFSAVDSVELILGDCDGDDVSI